MDCKGKAAKYDEITLTWRERWRDYFPSRKMIHTTSHGGAALTSCINLG